jgi:hypothetical protein
MSSGMSNVNCPFPSTSGSGNSFTPLSRMHCAYFRPAAFLSPAPAAADAVAVALAVPPPVATPPSSPPSAPPQPVSSNATSRPSTNPVRTNMTVSFGNVPERLAGQPSSHSQRDGDVALTTEPVIMA